MQAVINPEPVPISRIQEAVTSLSIRYLMVSACIPGADIVVFHPIA
jgi:hypothetical protein